MRFFLLLTILSYILPSIYGHTYLVSPKPRNFAAYQRTPAVLVGDVVKYPYTNTNKNSIPAWCGSPTISQTPGTVFPSTTVSNFPNAGPIVTNNVYTAGGLIKVYWYHPLAHDDPNVGTINAPLYTYGIRVAVNYSATDMVVLNVHTGGTTQSPVGVVNTHIEQGTGYDPVSLQDPGFVPNTTFVLPAGKTCNPCTLQFWLDAFSDKGSYIDCADIKIVAPTTATTATPTTKTPTTATPTTKTLTTETTPTTPASGTNTGSTTATTTPTTSTPIDTTTPTEPIPMNPSSTPFPLSSSTGVLGTASTVSSHMAFIVVCLMMCMFWL